MHAVNKKEATSAMQANFCTGRRACDVLWVAICAGNVVNREQSLRYWLVDLELQCLMVGRTVQS